MAEITMEATAALAFASAAGVSRDQAFAAIAALAFGAALPLPKNVPLAASTGITLASSSTVLGKSTIISAAATLDFSVKNCPDRGRDALGLCEVMADILHLWGFLDPRSAPSYAIERALTDLNSALQTIWNQSARLDYWTSETITLTLAANTGLAELPDEVQNVTGTCRLKDSRRPLANISSLGELETFSDLYLDGDNTSEPVAYHIERQWQTGKDPVKCVFHVTPEPTEETEFLLEVVKEAPRYGKRDLADCPRIPIPHRYVESLLMPVARYRATSFYLFDSPDKKPAIDADYAEARAALGLADPLPGQRMMPTPTKQPT